MDPQKPGDGISAGWITELALRENGEQLWGLVEWTDRAAGYIENKEYQFVSPSFVRDHTHKDGRKIGTTLLAAAITNHPFLEGMQALTLGTPALAGVHLHAALRDLVAAPVVNLAELGQHVSFLPDAERTPELTDEERGQTFVVKTTIGDGDNQFMRLARLDGTEFGWFRMNQLAPAPAQEAERTTEEKTMLDTTKTTDIEQKAAAFLRRLPKDYTAADVVNLSRQYPDEGEAYRLAGIGATQVEATPVPTPINLSVREGETFDDAVTRYANEKGVRLAVAAHAVAVAAPELAARR
jgi:hypothetical protein